MWLCAWVACALRERLPKDYTVKFPYLSCTWVFVYMFSFSMWMFWETCWAGLCRVIYSVHIIYILSRFSCFLFLDYFSSTRSEILCLKHSKMNFQTWPNPWTHWRQNPAILSSRLSNVNSSGFTSCGFTVVRSLMLFPCCWTWGSETQNRSNKAHTDFYCFSKGRPLHVHENQCWWLCLISWPFLFPLLLRWVNNLQRLAVSRVQ